MEMKFCKGCGKQINTMPVIGEKYYKFEDGVYCENCAKIKVDKKRSDLKKNG